MGKEGPKDRLEMVSREANLGKEGPKDRLEMVFKRANLGKEGPKDRQESQLGQRILQGSQTWAKKVPRTD